MADLVYQRVIRAQREKARPTVHQKALIYCPYCPENLANVKYDKKEQLLKHFKTTHPDRDVDLSEIEEVIRAGSERNA